MDREISGKKDIQMNAIRKIVADHYGVRGMPMIVMKMEDEIAKYEMEHTEVPPALWEYVNHKSRLVRMWARADLNVELVVKEGEEYRLVQDVCFLDAFPSAEAWRIAVYQLICRSQEVWVVFHGDEMPS